MAADTPVSENLRTTLYQTHVDLGARMVPFGGWDMPVQYEGTIAEVAAVRTGAGLFDVSHMGRLHVGGPNAAGLLDILLTGSASGLRVGRARYCFVCTESGGVIDDLIFYRLADDEFLVIPNAGNRPTVALWLDRQLAHHYDGRGAQITDRTMLTGLLALQGPESAGIIDALCEDFAPGTRQSTNPGRSPSPSLSATVFLGPGPYRRSPGFHRAYRLHRRGRFRARFWCGRC